MTLNETNDPKLKSWVESANTSQTDFPIQNLPFGRFRRAGSEQAWRIGVAIGDQVLDLKLASQAGAWSADVKNWLLGPAQGDLNGFMGLPGEARSEFRAALSRALRDDSAHQSALQAALVPQAQAQMSVPCTIGDYTDFYTGIYHATTVGRLFRPDNPLQPNYKWVPIGYHGRASSILVSGSELRRPLGQIKGDSGAPTLQPSRRIDYELELAAFVGPGNALGEPIRIDDAQEHLFGICLLNDWSARDVQAWEYQPLGPFLSKSFATSISPWVVTMEALAPYRKPFTRPSDDPQPLPYLASAANSQLGALDINLEVWLETAAMRSLNQPPVRLSESNAAQSAYWTLAQLVTHHTVNGCNLQSGDLLGSGTLSGPKPEQGGSLLELSSGGKRNITLPNGESRTFLEDGDRVILRGYCERAGAARIGLGEVSGTLLRSIDL